MSVPRLGAERRAGPSVRRGPRRRGDRRRRRAGRVQSMTKTDTRDVGGDRARRSARSRDAGCEIVRGRRARRRRARGVRARSARGRAPARRRHPLRPPPGDRGASTPAPTSVRINPGNIGGTARRSPRWSSSGRAARVPIRIGVNAGSLDRTSRASIGGATGRGARRERAAARADARGPRLPRDRISVKASDVRADTIAAYRLLAAATDYPLHLGVTEAGTGLAGTSSPRSASGILLAEGIGDTLRVSLTDTPAREVRVGRELLRALGPAAPGPSRRVLPDLRPRADRRGPPGRRVDRARAPLRGASPTPAAARRGDGLRRQRPRRGEGRRRRAGRGARQGGDLQPGAGLENGSGIPHDRGTDGGGSDGGRAPRRGRRSGVDGMLKRRTERRQADRAQNATLRLVLFQVGAERYGLDIAGVREIDRLHAITRVPQALSFVEGVIHLRGAIVPVVDLARRFGLEPPPVPERQTRIIVATCAARTSGFDRRRRHRGRRTARNVDGAPAAADVRAHREIRLRDGARRRGADRGPERRPRTCSPPRRSTSSPCSDPGPGAAQRTITSTEREDPMRLCPLPDPHPARRPGRGGDRQPQAHAARRADPQARRRRLHLPAARAARRCARSSGSSARRWTAPARQEVLMPGPAAPRSSGSETGPLGGLRQGRCCCSPGPARARVLPRPDARGGHHRPGRGARSAPTAQLPINLYQIQTKFRDEIRPALRPDARRASSS